MPSTATSKATWSRRAARADELSDPEAIAFAERFDYVREPTIGGLASYWAHEPVDAHEARCFLRAGGTYSGLPATPQELLEEVAARFDRLDANAGKMPAGD